MCFAFGVMLAWPSLTYPWFNDDLSLVRVYTSDEIARAFTGNWDSSGVFTAGYRPLTVLFNHTTSIVFGENVLLHRLLRIGVLAGYAVVLALIGIEFGMSRLSGLLAALLLLSLKNTWWMLVWPADGVRAFMALLGALAAYLLLLYLKRPAAWKVTASLFCFTLALLTREEALPLLTILPALGTAYLWRTRANGTPLLLDKRLRSLLLASGLALVSAAVYWLVRSSVVNGTAAVLTLDGWLSHLIWTLLPRLFSPEVMFWLPASALLWLLLVGMLLRLPPAQRTRAGLWLGCVVVAAAPGLIISRPNNLILPLGFFALFLASVITDFAARARPGVWVGGGLALVLLVGSLILHRTSQEALHPLSLDGLEEHHQYLWGEWSSAVIPQERRDQIAAVYRDLGIESREDFERRFPEIEAAARAENRYHPNDQNLPFEPVIGWLSG